MRVSAATFAFLFGIGLFSATFAATVSSIGGQVLVNQGDGYRQVVGTTEVKPGDSIVVNPGGSGQIVYPDGCSVQIQAGSVTTIAEASPCSTAGTGSGATTFAIGALIVGGGIGAAVLVGQGGDKSASP